MSSQTQLQRAVLDPTHEHFAPQPAQEAPLILLARPSRSTQHVQSGKCKTFGHHARGRHALRPSAWEAPLSRLARPGRPGSAMTLTAASAARLGPYVNVLLMHKQHEQLGNIATCHVRILYTRDLGTTACPGGTSQSLGQVRPTQHVQSRKCITLAHGQHASRQADHEASASRLARPSRPRSAKTLTAARAARLGTYASLLSVHKQHEN